MLVLKSNLAPRLPRFDHFLNGTLENLLHGENLFQDLTPWSRLSHTSSVPVNIREDEDKFIVELAAPGFSKEEFKIEVKEGRLVISTEKKVEEKGDEYSFRQFGYGSFSQSFKLNEKVIDKENITAKYEQGVLSVCIAKREEIKEEPKLIELA